MNSAIYSHDLLNISLAEITRFLQETECSFTSNFSDGFSDGENNFEPIVYQWFNSDYRQGYLLAIAKRIGVEYALVYDIETKQITGV